MNLWQPDGCELLLNSTRWQLLIWICLRYGYPDQSLNALGGEYTIELTGVPSKWLNWAITVLFVSLPRRVFTSLFLNPPTLHLIINYLIRSSIFDKEHSREISKSEEFHFRGSFPPHTNVTSTCEYLPHVNVNSTYPSWYFCNSLGLKVWVKALQSRWYLSHLWVLSIVNTLLPRQH